MATININRVTITGNLTADPELRVLSSGTTLCKMRVACNERRKNGATGQWEDRANYFDVTVWGKNGENAARYLRKGRPVALDGRLEWREWEAPDGSNRQAVGIVADTVQFLGGSASKDSACDAPATEAAEQFDFSGMAAAPAAASRDEIPF